jgi:fatty acid desaturase
MDTVAPQPSRSLFRDRQAAFANTAVLLWVSIGWLSSFALMGNASPLLNILGVFMCTNTMVLAAYLIHEAAHQTLFAKQGANFAIGEALNFVAGSSYASFQRIRHMHIRHHMDRADLTCFDFKSLLQGRPALRRALELMEWSYIPATEILMHLQVVWRPFVVRSQRRYLPRSLLMLVVRGALLALLAIWSVKALVLYSLSVALFLHVLNFFDAFHHTFEQFFVDAEQPLPLQGRTRAYEQANTYSNLISVRFPSLNLLTLNFGYHNAHHERASVPWYRLPAYHRSLYADQSAAVMPLSKLIRTWHRNRVKRVGSEHYGESGGGMDRIDDFVGAHGVSFLTVV